MFQGTLGLSEISPPFGNAKVLEFPPSLGADQLASPLAKDIAPAASNVRLITFGIGNPRKNLVGEDIVAQGGNVGLALGPHISGQED